MTSRNRPQKPPDLVVEVAFLTMEEGGRRTPVPSGYRPGHDFGLPGTQNVGQHEYLTDWVQPGETAVAGIWLLAPELLVGRLTAGFRFGVYEGSHLMARGTILRVLNPSLESGE